MNWNKPQSRKTIPSATADRSDVVRGHDDPADVVRVGSEWALKLLWLASPLPDDEPVDCNQQPDRHDYDPQDASALDRANDDPVNTDTAAERDRERRGEGEPVAPAVIHDERPGDVGRERRHLALREVDDSGRAVNDHERECEQRVDPTRREARHDLLHEVGERGDDH